MLSSDIKHLEEKSFQLSQDASNTNNNAMFKEAKAFLVQYNINSINESSSIMSESPIFSQSSPVLCNNKPAHIKKDNTKTLRQKESPKSNRKLNSSNDGQASNSSILNLAKYNLSLQSSIPVKKSPVKKESSVVKHAALPGSNKSKICNGQTNTADHLKTKYETRIANLNKSINERKEEAMILKKEIQYARKAFLEVKDENDILRSKLNNMLSNYDLDSEKLKEKCPPDVESPIFDLNLNSLNNAPSSVWYRKLFDHNEKLHDQILKLEDENYTTLEDLQAKCQEITDIQRKYEELKESNTALRFERDVVLETLCTQTEKLEQSRLQISNLKYLISNDKAEITHIDKESVSLNLFRESEKEKKTLQEKVSELNKTIENLHNELRSIRDKNIELKKVATKDLRNDELFVEHESSCSTSYPSHLSNNGESRSCCDKLVQTLICVDYESMLSRLNADLEKLRKTNDELTSELKEKDCETRSLKETISRLECEVHTVKSELEMSRTEWQQYECDLLVSVRVADEYKTHMETQFNQLTEDYQILRARFETTQAQNSTVKHSVWCQAPDGIEFASSSCQTSDLLSRPQSNSLCLRCKRNSSKCLPSSIFQSGHASNTSENTSSIVQNSLHTNYSLGQLSAELSSLPLSHAKSFSNLPHFTESQELDTARLNTKNEEDKDKIYRTASQSRLPIDCSSMLSHSNIRERVITSVDNELDIVRRSKMHSSVPGDSHTTSVKNIILSIEKQISHEDCLTSDYVSDRNCSSSYRRPAQLQRHKSGPSKLLSPKPLGHHNGDSQRKSLGNLSSMSTSSQLFTLPTSSLRESSTSLPFNVSKLPSIYHNGRFQSNLEKNHLHNPILADPLDSLVKQMGGSRRNCLLNWCQNRTASYDGVEITNFSTSWNDGRALCALLHSYKPADIDYSAYFRLSNQKSSYKERYKNISLLVKWAETIGVTTTDKIVKNMASDKPDWNIVMAYVIDLFRHFESSVL